MANKKSNTGSVIIVCLIVVLIAVIAVFGYKYISADINGTSGSSDIVTLTIADGSDQYSISQKLYQNGIVINDSLWSNWMDKHYPDIEYIGGDYEFRENMSYDEVAKSLQNPIITRQSVSVCIPEGYNVFKIASTMEENGVCKADDFLNACKDKSAYNYSFITNIPDNELIAYPLEGFLFPATYDLAENMQAYEVVDTMLRAFSDRISDDWTEYCENNNMTLFELVTLASIVEKETLGYDVAGNIASVFINRLNEPQKLQSDVTIFYGNELRDNGFSDDVVESYNTYKCAALPSGPICNPGVANIDAVVNHPDTDYFYFFSDLEQNFHFAETYSEFESLLNQYPWQ